MDHVDLSYNALKYKLNTLEGEIDALKEQFKELEIVVCLISAMKGSLSFSEAKEWVENVKIKLENCENEDE